MTLWPRMTISPMFSGPGGSGLSSRSTIRTSTPQIGLPTESTLRCSALMLKVVVLAVSESP